jgi:hypothetical protein
MNTKILMTASALVLGAIGLTFTFAPDISLEIMGIPTSVGSLLLGQVFGGLYFGFAMLNWMVKGSRIGGIYNRPVVIANMSHFLIAGLAIGKSLASGSTGYTIFWIMGGIYMVFGLLFLSMLFRHFFSDSQN